MRLSKGSKYLVPVLAISVTALVAHAAKVGQDSSNVLKVEKNSVVITGSVWKQNEKSDLHANLKVLSANGAGYGLVGEGLVSNLRPETNNQPHQHQGGSADLNFDNMKFLKIGTSSSKGSAASDPGHYTREGDIDGTIHVVGLNRGSRSFKGDIAGIGISGSWVDENKSSGWGIGSKSDEIKFANLTVDGTASAGAMGYYKGGYNSYYAENGLRFGRYEIHALEPDDSKNAFLKYDPSGDVFTFNMRFGTLAVTGNIVFHSTDETHYHSYTVTEHNQVISNAQSTLNMMNWMDDKASFNTIMMRSLVIQGVGQAADQYTSKQVQKTDTIHNQVATEGEYTLTVTGSKPLSINGDVDSEDPSEHELRALLSYLVLTSYDSFADD